jgi:hypothetical protein
MIYGHFRPRRHVMMPEAIAALAPRHSASDDDRERGAMRQVACVVAATVYVWQEQREYLFPTFQFAASILGIGALSVILCLFHHGSSRIQPPAAIAGFLRLVGRHTLEVNAIQLAGSELLSSKLVFGLAP